MIVLCQKNFFTDRQTDRRTTQNYSSEPHNSYKTSKAKSYWLTHIEKSVNCES
jgi:hypothetical protein